MLEKARERARERDSLENARDGTTVARQIGKGLRGHPKGSRQYLQSPKRR